jgi:hypothetical protein
MGMAAALTLGACSDSANENATSDFTGNETVYALQAGSQYNISGTATVKEKKDGTAQITVKLAGTDGNLEFPVHLHQGDISAPDVNVYAQLNPVTSTNGESETNLVKLADESTITYKELLNLNACIKVHLGASGPDRDIILAGGNIGTAATKDISAGRIGLAVCKSE